MTTDSTPQGRLETAADWRRRQAEGFSQDERDAFATWIADEMNAEAFERADRAWAAFDATDDEALALLRRRVTRRVRSDRGRRLARDLGAAAAVLVVCIGGFGFYRMQTAPEIYAASDGVPSEVRLDDGSVIILDAGARLSARMGRGKRTLELVEGQARFDVAHDPGRPFRVDVGAGVVQAVGTVFNIDRQAGVATVTLVEGAVDVYGDAGAATRLAPGQQVQIDEQGKAAGRAPVGAVRSIDTETATIWKGRRMQFDNTPLREAVARFNHTSDRQVRLADGALGDLRVSGAFTYGDADAFGLAISKLFDLDLAEEAGAVVLKTAAD